MYNKLIEWGTGVTADILPEGRFKEFLRILLFRNRAYNRLDALNEIVAEAELLEDGSMLVTLNDGVKFYARRDEEILGRTRDYLARIRSRYGNSHILAKTATFEYFGTLWDQLGAQYVEDTYQEYYNVKKGDIVVDVGAHIGTFAVRAAKAVGAEGMVVAIEPEMNNLRLLERNIRANKVGNVVIVPKGVWARKDRLKLHMHHHTGGHSVLCYEDKDRFTEIEVDTLDNILREQGISKVDFIKMDIEGAEIEAYSGMKETLQTKDLNLAIAAYHIIEGKETCLTVAPWLQRDGFEVCVRGGIIHARKEMGVQPRRSQSHNLN